MAGQNLELNVRFFEPEDEAEVIDLVTSVFSALSKDLWLWKYPRNPHFDRSLVFVAENGSRVVGCTHFLPREFKIAGSLKVKAALGADLAVHPDYRQRGIGSSMLRFPRSSRALEEKGITVTYGFIDCQRASFFGRNTDSVIIATSTAMYQKFFDISPIEKRFAFLGRLTRTENRFLGDLRQVNMNVLFRLIGMPPFTLTVEDGKINVSMGEHLSPDLAVQGDPYFLESIYEGNKKIWKLMIGILKAKIKIRGGIWRILKFHRIIKSVRRLSPQEG